MPTCPFKAPIRKAPVFGLSSSAIATNRATGFPLDTMTTPSGPAPSSNARLSAFNSVEAIVFMPVL